MQGFTIISLFRILYFKHYKKEIEMKNIAYRPINQNWTQCVDRPILQGQRAINILVQQNMLLKRQLSQIFNFNPHLINQFNYQKPIIVQQNINIPSNISDQRLSVQISNYDENETCLIQNSYRQKINKLKTKKNCSHERRLSQCKSSKVVFQTNVDKISNGQLMSNNNSRCIKPIAQSHNNQTNSICKNSQTNSVFKMNQPNSKTCFKQNNFHKELQTKMKILSKHLQKRDNIQHKAQNNNEFQQKNAKVLKIKENKQQIQSRFKQQIQSRFIMKQNNQKTIRNSFSLSKKIKLQSQKTKIKFVPKDPAIFNIKKSKEQNNHHQIYQNNKNQNIIDNNRINEVSCQNNKLKLQNIKNQKQPNIIQTKQLRGNIYLKDEQQDKSQKINKLDKQGKIYKNNLIQNLNKNNLKLNEAKTYRKRQNNLNNQSSVINDSQVVSLQYFMKSDENNYKKSMNSDKPEQKQLKNKLFNNVYVEEE